MTRRGRHRLRIALVVIVYLLLQQVAWATYACTLTSLPAQPVAMSEACAGMGMEKAKEFPALCEKHCAPDQSVATDHIVLSVPALALPPPAFASIVSGPMTHVALAAEVPIDRSDPPLRLRYCSLLV